MSIADGLLVSCQPWQAMSVVVGSGFLLGSQLKVPKSMYTQEAAGLFTSSDHSGEKRAPVFMVERKPLKYRSQSLITVILQYQ